MSKEVEISTLEYPNCVRVRRGMYISNLNQMITEIIDNSVDEHIAGYCNMIGVSIVNGVITIEDNGRGINVNPSKKDPSKSQVELAFSSLHAGGKFGGSGSYDIKTTSGLHGVGGSCVNALSEYMTVLVNKSDKKYQIDFSRGYVTEKLRTVEKTSEDIETGTTVIFKPDNDIWSEQPYIDFKALEKRIKELAYLNPNLMFYYLVDDKNSDGEEIKKESVINEPEGLKSYLSKLCKNKEPVTDEIFFNENLNEKVKKINSETGETESVDIVIECTIAMRYVDSYTDNFITFCNNSSTVEHGDHLTGFTMALNESIKKYIELNNVKLKYETKDIYEGLIAIISIKIPDPDYDGQNKQKLKMPIVRSAIKKIVSDKFFEYLDFNPQIAKDLMSKIEKAAKAREAAKRAREATRKQKESKDNFTSDKLAACQSKNPEECEIFIVEGDSAGGSAKQGRDRKNQAIFASFGKINNVEKQRADKVASSQKIMSVANAIGCDILENYKEEDLKYHKVVLMSDSDIDGCHINCLWITFFYRYMKDLISKGHLYVACPPLYKATKNKKTYYLADDKELKSFKDNNGTPDNIQRFKGLGEMSPEQLWETTMNPETRTLIRVSIEEAENADAIVSLLMGDLVEPRRDYIIDNGNFLNDMN